MSIPLFVDVVLILSSYALLAGATRRRLGFDGDQLVADALSIAWLVWVPFWFLFLPLRWLYRIGCK